MAISFNKRTWVDRDVENPAGRTITNDTTGVSENVTVAFNEGEVYVEGDEINASNINDLEDRIESAFEESTEVSVTQTVESGMEIASITVDDTEKKIYIPIDDSGAVSTSKLWSNKKVDDTMKDTADTNALRHLGFYLDENGGLCQVNTI